MQFKTVAIRLVRAFCPLVDDESYPQSLRCMQKKDFDQLLRDVGLEAKWQLAIIHNIVRSCYGPSVDIPMANNVKKVHYYIYS